MPFKPTEYLNSAKKEFEEISSFDCDEFLSRAINHNVFQKICISGVDKKYEKRMQKVWNLIILNIIFKNASVKYSMPQKHKILNKIIQNNQSLGL